MFGNAKVPATAQRFTKEWVSDPDALASGLVAYVEDDMWGLCGPESDHLGGGIEHAHFGASDVSTGCCVCVALRGVQAGLSETGDRAHQDGRDGPTDIQQAIFPVISHDRHLRGRRCDLVAPNAVRPERDEITIPGSMPNYGKRAKLILKWLGYDDGTINQMVADGSAGLRWSEKYLPE